MRKSIAVIFTLLILVAFMSGRGATMGPILAADIPSLTGDKSLPVWIYFRDKGFDSSTSIDIALQESKRNLSERVAWRRGKVRSDANLVDERDLPVSGDYIQDVLNTGVRLRTTSRWLNAVSVYANANQIDALLQLPQVHHLERVFCGHRLPVSNSLPIITPTPSPVNTRNDYGPSQGQLEQINSIAAHEAGYAGQGIIVLMLDTGFFKDHVAIPNEQIIAEWDFINDDGNTQNEDTDGETQHNHGTATLTTLGGSWDGELYGPAYQAQFLLGKTEDVSQEEPIEEDWYVAGLEWGESLGADIASSSLGYIDWYTLDDLDGLTAVTTIAVNTAIEYGMIVTTAAGNQGDEGLMAPADAFDVLACGAVNIEGEIASFSSRGPTADGRIKPEVCALGIYTYCASGSDIQGFRYANGTSLSTPLIGGVCAQVLSANPNWTPVQVRHALMSTASQAETPDNDYGWGILDVMAALTLLQGLGDLNQDQELNILDVVLLVNFIVNQVEPTDQELFLGDGNGDGVLDVLDVVSLIGTILSTGP